MGFMDPSYEFASTEARKEGLELAKSKMMEKKGVLQFFLSASISLLNMWSISFIKYRDQDDTLCQAQRLIVNITLYLTCGPHIVHATHNQCATSAYEVT